MVAKDTKQGFASLWGVYHHTAKKRNYEFSLTKDEFRELTKADCWYCGKQPSQIKKARKTEGSYLYNGIDRVDNEKGYVYENCVPCCGKCNKMKMTMPCEDFIAQVRKIAQNMALLL